MSRQDSNNGPLDRFVQAFRRYVDAALVVIGGVTEVYAAVSPLVAEWKRRER